MEWYELAIRCSNKLVVSAKGAIKTSGEVQSELKHNVVYNTMKNK